MTPCSWAGLSVDYGAVSDGAAQETGRAAERGSSPIVFTVPLQRSGAGECRYWPEPAQVP